MNLTISELKDKVIKSAHFCSRDNDCCQDALIIETECGSYFTIIAKTAMYDDMPELHNANIDAIDHNQLHSLSIISDVELCEHLAYEEDEKRKGIEKRKADLILEANNLGITL